MRLLPLLFAFAALPWSLGCTLTLSQQSFLVRHTAPLPTLSQAVVRRNVELVVSKGVTLRGWYLQKPGSRRTVLFFHGNGAGIISSTWALYWFADALNADVLAFDYRGYGFSEGQPSIDPIVDDSLRIHTFLVEELGKRDRPLLVIGQSMGTAPAIHLAANRDVAGLILLSPLSSYEDLVSAVKKVTPWYVRVKADESLTNLRTSPLADLHKVRAPTLIIHGTRDELATPEVVRRVKDACGAPEKMVCTVAGTHNDVHATNPAVRPCIERFGATLPMADAVPAADGLR
jgi:uncharacterized protein